VFVVVNLFIAVVINNLESVKHEQQADADRHSPHHALLQSIEDIRARLEEMERQLRDTGPPRTAPPPAHPRPAIVSAPQTSG
jgi:hypothetical protein